MHIDKGKYSFRGNIYDTVTVQPAREIMSSLVSIKNNTYIDIMRDGSAVIIPYTFLFISKPLWPLIGGAGMITAIVSYEFLGIALHVGAISKNSFKKWVNNPGLFVKDFITGIRRGLHELSNLRKNAEAMKKWIAGEFKRKIASIKRTVRMTIKIIVRLLKESWKKITSSTMSMSMSDIICSNHIYIGTGLITKILRIYFKCPIQNESAMTK